MAGYYRNIGSGCSSVVAQLTNLLKTEAKYLWSPECQNAFIQVKNLLHSAPVLAAPQLREPFQLHQQVDAGNVGAGGVLL